MGINEVSQISLSCGASAPTPPPPPPPPPPLSLGKLQRVEKDSELCWQEARRLGCCAPVLLTCWLRATLGRQIMPGTPGFLPTYPRAAVSWSTTMWTNESSTIPKPTWCWMTLRMQSAKSRRGAPCMTDNTLSLVKKFQWDKKKNGRGIYTQKINLR